LDILHLRNPCVMTARSSRSQGEQSKGGSSLYS
jgi:hypothetical protein